MRSLLLGLMRRPLAELARRLGFALIGIAFVAVGAGFIVAATWSLLAWNYGSVAASGILGLLFLGLGLIVFAVPQRKRRTPLPRQPIDRGARPNDLTTAFLRGLETGRIIGRR